MKKSFLIVITLTLVFLLSSCNKTLDYSNPYKMEHELNFPKRFPYSSEEISKNKGRLQAIEGVVTDLITKEKEVILRFGNMNVLCSIDANLYKEAKITPLMFVRVLGFLEKNVSSIDVFGSNLLSDHTLFKNCIIDRVEEPKFEIDFDSYNLEMPYNSEFSDILQRYKGRNVTIIGTNQSTDGKVKFGNGSMKEVYVYSEYFDYGTQKWEDLNTHQYIKKGSVIRVHGVIYYNGVWTVPRILVYKVDIITSPS